MAEQPPARLRGRRVALHVSGGIALVKVPELITRLRREGAEVRVAMTPTATALISPTTLQALSGQPVAWRLPTPRGGRRSAEEAAPGHGMAHLQLASWAELQLVAPATASTLARLALGLADDVVSATLLASPAPLLLAPAMETGMWRAAATQANLATLRGRGASVVGPVSGRLASGREGEGRMAEPGEILEAALALLSPAGPMRGWEVLVTAGGTREPIDPVRFLGNRSSGRMGLRLAAEAARRGALVRLVSTVPQPDLPEGVELIPVETGEEMLRACLRLLPRARLLLMAAAVADYRLERPSERKLHRSEAPELELRLVANVDVLAELSRARPRDCLVVGFAAETEDVRRRGEEKLRRKGCDLLVANQVGGERSAMGGDHAAATLLATDGRVTELAWEPKAEIAARILDEAERLAARVRPAAPD